TPDTASLAAARADSLEARFRIQYPDGNDTLLHAFFRTLQNLPETKELVRALHYGDSQVEGDRITAFLRNNFQNRFGGCGVGLVPLVDPLGNRMSLQISSDAAWKRSVAYGGDFRRSSPRHYGLLGSYYNFSFQYRQTVPGDSAARDSLARAPKLVNRKRDKVWVEYSKAHGSYLRGNRFENIKLLYNNHGAALKLKVQSRKDSINVYELAASEQPQVMQVPFRETFRKVRLSFEGSGNPEFYAAALDCNYGVALDNMPFRGSSGTEFVRMDRNLLKSQFEALNVKLIILQFGVNVVPYVINDYTYYEKQFYNQLKLLRELAPEASILVVGVSDMSRKEGEVYTTYPNVEKIRDAQRKAAFRAGCAFWDLYTAMGGKDSMPSWVNAKPALANKDFTHFSPKGAQLVAEMLFKSLMTEYENFSQR
ncbi:MAG TPA: GDSL-type esterase/lipase family protein, partial [Adhaeribacter sp.]|nr:GDSL-type esterase/lipase family protein [Adhaeribacter sp.]